MTHTLTHDAREHARPNNGPFARLRASWARYREYRKTLAELSALTDRDLADLDISRSDIGYIAYQGAYGR
jgi:uncharacterized protein YjiS (DUF1127 family)